ncbi:MAG: hypothetical protein K2Q12_01515 [Rickettsiales bacterium]|nr:hypothetical protein [Rickettsiales bacterium]
MAFQSYRQRFLDAMGIAPLREATATRAKTGSLDCEELFGELRDHELLEAAINALIYDTLLHLGYKMPTVRQFRPINFRDKEQADAALTMFAALFEGHKEAHYAAMRQWLAEGASELAAGETWDSKDLLDDICGAHLEGFNEALEHLTHAASDPLDREGHMGRPAYEQLCQTIAKIVSAAEILAKHSQKKPLEMEDNPHPALIAVAAAQAERRSSAAR